MRSLPHSTRRWMLLAIAGLVVSFVRTILQYGETWGSLTTLLVSWFVHYLALALVAAVAFGIGKQHERRFLDEHDRGRVTLNAMLFYTAVLAIVASLAILFLAYLPEGAFDDTQ